MDVLLQKVLRHIRRRRLLEGMQSVTIALSGGPDSVALTLVLQELLAAGKLNLDLRLAHLNHGLRGSESEAEEEFCRNFAHDRGLPIAVGRRNVAAIAESRGGSLEAVAREVRYDFLLRVAREHSTGAVATGHHGDDVAETVLLRIIRGAGVPGLGGLAPSRPLDGEVRLVRPLLCVRRSELREYLWKSRQPFCQDSSNRDTRYLRNQVRHELIPALQRDFPTFSVESLMALGESAVEVGSLLRKLAEELWDQACLEASAGEVTLDASALAGAETAVRERVFRRALEKLAGGESAPALRAEHYRALAALPGAEVGAETSLPDGFFARREHGIVYLARRGPAATWTPRRLPVPGEVEMPRTGVQVRCERLPAGSLGPKEAEKRASPGDVFISANAVAEPLTVRCRRPGDRFHPLGAPGGARLKEFFINAKVPRHKRDRIPLVVDARDNILWVVGHRIGEPFKLNSDGEPVLRLSVGSLEPGS